ncbi:MAG: hypothetical protein DCC68_24985 [Planctomycetota bacterium]|nr:MAG: hypothetical protein DCC68_24985 [Planctomycetota bacterium]
MREFRLASGALAAFTFAASLVLGTCPADAAESPPPTYRTLAPANARTKRGETRYRAEVQALPAQPYAWGWFGAKPRPQSSWQRGFYGDPRFWSRGGW